MKRLYELQVLLYLTVFLSACGGGSDQNDILIFDPFTDQIQPGNFNIGYFPLYNYRIDAAQLALAQINANGGVLNGQTLSLVTINAQTLGRFDSNLIELTQAMIQTYGIQIIGASTSLFTQQLAKITVPAQVLQISEASTSPSVSDLVDHDFIFRVAPSDIYAAQLLADLVLDKGSLRCVVIYNENDPYGQGLAQAFQQKMQLNGGEIIDNVEIPQNLNIGFNQYLARIYDPQPDCVFSILTRSSSTANLINESISSSFKGYYVFSDAVLAAGFIDNLAKPSQLRGSFALSSGRGSQDNSAYLEFVDSYQSQFGQEPLNYSAHIYDLMYLLALAIEHAAATQQTNTPTSTAIRDSLRIIANPAGIEITPNRISEGLTLARQGLDIDYNGASNPSLFFDEKGDVGGDLVYELFEYDEDSQSLQSRFQTNINQNTN